MLRIVAATMAGSFEATLSVSDRPELTSLAVTAVPIDPPAVERAAAGDGTTDRREPEQGVGGKGQNNGNEADASTAEKQRKTAAEREEPPATRRTSRTTTGCTRRRRRA